jgi:hypothetical protein
MKEASPKNGLLSTRRWASNRNERIRLPALTASSYDRVSTIWRSGSPNDAVDLDLYRSATLMYAAHHMKKELVVELNQQGVSHGSSRSLKISLGFYGRCGATQ